MEQEGERTHTSDLFPSLLHMPLLQSSSKVGALSPGPFIDLKHLRPTLNGHEFEQTPGDSEGEGSLQSMG